ncbi:MAG: DNA replication and repair protein RecF [Phycisphaerae bacterium]|nr:DNA replication and repair protein RecF [Phycisphaerae bacterium]
MIQLEEVHIEELRGIRKLTLAMNRKSFAIQGPNGSGKSGVVDAIEFGLTGDMTRLSGKGTAGLTVKTHGPHVDARDYPDAAFVRLKVYLLTLNKHATIVRKAKKPTEPDITPADSDIQTVLATVAEHPEITLTRRQIIKLILTEATSRSKDVQTLLRLDSISQARATLKTASNRAGNKYTEAQASSNSAADTLRRHFDLPKLVAADIITAANKHRAALGLKPLTELTAETSLKEGVPDARVESERINRDTTLRDVRELTARVSKSQDPKTTSAAQLLICLDKIKAEPTLLTTLQRRAFFQTGLDYATEEACPLCDTEWNIDELRAHLQTKLKQSQAAEAVEQELRLAKQTVSADIDSVVSLVAVVQKAAVALKDELSGQALKDWHAGLSELKTTVQTTEGAESARLQLSGDWHKPPKKAIDALARLDTAVDALPDRSAVVQAHTFLIVAQERLDALQKARRHEEKMARAAKIAAAAYKAYCDAAEQVLSDLYNEVQESFAGLYRLINHDDEGEFTAKLSPSEGKLELMVDFHKRGLFPPGAYHSEGHQDGMGLCLYFALMKRLLGESFSLAVLDDVVMSVDNQHRKELCNLLKTQFPHTQFVITTHEQAWFHQMRSAGIVNKASCVTFRSWTVDHGPLVDESKDVWEKIAEQLAKEEVSEAAAVLRRHLEFVSHELASNLGASTPHRLEGGHELGELLPNVVSRFKALLGKAADSTQAWKNEDAKKAIADYKHRFSECTTRSNVENWAVNSAVHYNAWAEFVRQDFEPVVAAYKDLLACLMCPACGSWLHVSPRRGLEEAVRCECLKVSLNLTKPGK